MTGYYTVALPPPNLSARTRPFELKKEAKYNLFTLKSILDGKTIPDWSGMLYSSTGSSDLFLYPCAFCFWYFLYLSFSTLYFSSLWRSRLSNTRHVYLRPPPPPTPSNVFEINKTMGGGGGLIEDLRYFSTWKWFIRGYIVGNRKRGLTITWLWR